jgi:release factor glutamine methyltransferase
MMLIELLQESIETLNAAGIPDSPREAELVLAALLGISPARLFLDKGKPLTPSDVRHVRSGMKRRAERWPLAYITGDQPFRDLMLMVSPAVLIPRPETEQLVERALERIRDSEGLLEVADIGTGSGCIAISLARDSKVRHVWAVDRSAEALNVAFENVEQLQLSPKCTLLKGDLTQPLSTKRLFVDLLIANLPYIAKGDMAGLEPEVRREPRSALLGGEDGLDVIRRLLLQAPSVLVLGGWVMLEIGIHQDAAVQALFETQGVWENIAIHKDYAGIPRFAEAQRKG